MWILQLLYTNLIIIVTSQCSFFADSKCIIQWFETLKVYMYNIIKKNWKDTWTLFWVRLFVYSTYFVRNFCFVCQKCSKCFLISTKIFIYKKTVWRFSLREYNLDNLKQVLYRVNNDPYQLYWILCFSIELSHILPRREIMNFTFLSKIYLILSVSNRQNT